MAEEDKNKIDRYESDKQSMFYNNHCRRMFFCVLAVCFTFITIVVAYSFREKNWIDLVDRLCTPVATEAANGTQQSRDP